ncbi:MAG: two pore domain potassium channel family protein [Rivularia sp. (in: Bacteria)]|nr:two pore domain potassium channel family protein [Rivularia sp. MS3]
MNWIWQTIGVILISICLIDLYLTVLYPRSGKSLLSMQISKLLWKIFCLTSRIVSKAQQRSLLSYCGPTVLVVIAAFWVTLLMVGFAFIFLPALGTAIKASNGNTPTDFITALYYSGYCLTTLGMGDLVPQTGFYRFLTILEAALGFSIFTLTLTYFLSVYSSLTRRNTFALSLQHRSASKGNAVEMVVRLGADGNFTGVRQEIEQIAQDLLQLFESHHSYPVLHYFRFQKAYYSLARIALITMDTETLIKSALNQEKYRFLINSTAVTELEHGGLHMLRELSNYFLPNEPFSNKNHLEKEWREWYYYAVKRLKDEGIEVNSNLETGADCYVALRSRWNHYVVAFADYMMYRWNEIAPVPDNFDNL